MNYIKSVAALCVAVAFLTGCDPGDFGDLNVNPNRPSEAYTSMLFTRSCTYIRYFTMTSSSYDPWPMEWTGYLSESKNNQYGSMQTTVSFGTADYYRYALKNLNLIIQMNEDEGKKNLASVLSFGSNANQVAAAKTLRAFFFMTLTDILGPIPYSEALKGESEGIWTPAFDSQEFIYASLDADLQEAYAQFDEDSSLSDADILYQGDISRWKKFNASLRMMMAIKLADVDPANGKSRFAKAYQDGGMTQVADGFHYTFGSDNNPDVPSYSWMYYVGNPDYASANQNFVPNQVLVEALKAYRDNRLFAYCDLNGYKGDREGDPDSFDSYFGVPFGLASPDAVYDIAAFCCSVDARYCEPQATYGIITTARTLLVEAEAATLGRIDADADALYQAGIRASFAFSGADGVDAYLQNPKVILSSDKAEALKQIVMQRFLAGFLTDGIEAWSDWRRYNIPELPIEPGQADVGITVYPYRMQYSDADKQYNVANAEAAIRTYLNGDDSRWQRVWWDVADND